MSTKMLKLAVSSMLALTLMTTNLQHEGNTAYAYYDSTSDIALLQPATTDSEGGSTAAFYGNDGDVHSRWCASNGNKNHWWQTDLQGYYDLNNIKIKFEKDGVIYKYKIEGSTDSITWTTLSDQLNSTSRTQNQVLDVSASNIRYVKITFESIQGGYWASFYDFNVYGSKTAGSNVALNSVAFGDSEQLEHRASYAVDGKTDTAWSGEDAKADHYIKLDLGQLYDISGARMYWGIAGLNYKYKIEVSSDNVKWKKVSDKNGEAKKAEITQANITAANVRFVRLTVTEGYLPSLKELEVFGTLSPVTNIAEGKESKSDSADPANPAANANDGDKSSRWRADDRNPNHWWQVDFNGIADLTGTEIRWEKKGVTYNYKIDVSINERDWTTVVDNTYSNPSTAQIQTNTFHASNVRFLRVTLSGISGGNDASIHEVKVNGRVVRDETVLNLEARKDFDYFWNHVSTTEATYGLIREGSWEAEENGYPYNTSSISSTGFGLTAIPIGVSRGWITREQGYDRALRTLNTLRKLQETTSWNGHMYHYYGLYDGKPGGSAEWNLNRSCILDTVLMINGAIMAGEYFGGEVKAKADEIFNATNWEAFRDPATNLFRMEYNFDTKSFTSHLNPNYNEGMLMHIYGAGSSTFPLANNHTIYTWNSPKKKYGFNVEQVVSGTDFVFQYPQQIVDFRNLVDNKGFDWWNNSVISAMNAKKFATDYQGVYRGFGPDSWGLVACQGPNGYRYYASAPYEGTDFNYLIRGKNDGTISPSGPAGFLNMIPKYGTRVLDYYYYNLPKTWDSTLGFVDSFNRDMNFYSPYVLAYDKGIALQGIENNRTGLIWHYMMQSDVVQTGLSKTGFREKADQ